MEQEHKIKSKKIEAGIIGLTVILAVIYFYPRVVGFHQARENTRIAATCKTYVDKTLERVRDVDSADKKKKKKADLVKISNELVEDMNNASGSVPFVSAPEKCARCCVVEFDKKTNTLVVTGLDRDSEVLMRTVINPPSFVTYER